MSKRCSEEKHTLQLHDQIYEETMESDPETKESKKTILNCCNAQQNMKPWIKQTTSIQIFSSEIKTIFYFTVL
jgi:hypothetical protein